VIVEFVYGIIYNSLALMADAGHNLSDVLGLLIVWEAIQRFSTPQVLDGIPIIIVATIGVVINGVTAYLFLSNKDKDLNIKGAYLHML